MQMPSINEKTSEDMYEPETVLPYTNEEAGLYKNHSWKKNTRFEESNENWPNGKYRGSLKTTEANIKSEEVTVSSENDSVCDSSDVDIGVSCEYKTEEKPEENDVDRDNLPLEITRDASFLPLDVSCVFKSEPEENDVGQDNQHLKGSSTKEECCAVGRSSGRRGRRAPSFLAKAERTVSTIGPGPSYRKKRRRKEVNGGGKLVCDACAKVYSRKGNLMSHIFTVHMQQNVSSSGQSHRRRDVKGTLGNAHEERSNIIDGEESQKRLPDTACPDRMGIKNEEIMKSLQCKICHRTLRTSASYARHVEVHNTERSYGCNDCGRKFSKKSTLVHHIKSHVGEILYGCKFCSRKFANRSSLHCHLLLHSSVDGLFQCQVCSEKFPSLAKLKMHSGSHSDKEPIACDVCSRVFARKCFLNRHKKRVHSSEKPLDCTECGKQLKCAYDLKIHMKSHKGEQYKCDLCRRSYRRYSNLREHLLRHSGPKCFECKVCSGKFTSYRDLKIHGCEHTKHKDYACDICGKSFPVKYRLAKHLRIHSDDKPYECGVCAKKFRDKFNLKYHYRVHTGEKPFQCEVCGRRFVTSSHLKEHSYTHSDLKAFECEVCREKFQTRTKLKSHRRSHSSEEPFTCEKCGKSFRMRYQLAKHVRNSHGDPQVSGGKKKPDKPFQCEVCPKRFAQFRSLKVHLFTHTPEQPYKCDSCGQEFPQRTAFEKHLTNHAGEEKAKEDQTAGRADLSNSNRRWKVHVQFQKVVVRPYGCDVCQSRFYSRHALTDHLRIHSGEKPYVCQVCQKGFTQNGTLRTHMKIHTGEKPFECHLCGHKVSTRGHLKLHLRAHSGEKPFQCKVCGHRFFNSGGLKSHERKHTGERPYECTLCKVRFADSSGLTRHLKIHARKGVVHFRRRRQTEVVPSTTTGEEPSINCDVTLDPLASSEGAGVVAAQPSAPTPTSGEGVSILQEETPPLTAGVLLIVPFVEIQSPLNFLTL